MDKEQLTKVACNLILANLGEVACGYYKDFYQKQDEDTIVKSVRELLTELVGPSNAAKQLKQAGINFNN
ncbi:MAG: hypothetical protein PHT51_02230 [Patescibacteria group bacterium]|nr:hypothetical protein [Patescibacteria group bacterium]MDD4611299.1 hypothetical protein [Patescibacteria group bacterium]